MQRPIFITRPFSQGLGRPAKQPRSRVCVDVAARFRAHYRMQTRPSPVSRGLLGPKRNDRTLKRLYASLQVGNALQNLVKRAGDAAKGNGRICNVAKRHRSIVD
jgi:hypothetical protein